MNKEDQAKLVKMLTADNARMRKAGCDLALAALRIIRDYDGVHRLALAVSEWMKVVGTEGSRSERFSERQD